MAYETTFKPAEDRFETVLSGLVLPPDILRLDNEIINSPYWRQGISRLVEVKPSADLSAFTFDVLTQELFPALQDRRREHDTKERIAWVVPSDFQRLVVQVWEVMPAARELENFRVFTTRPEALAWLSQTTGV